MVPNNKQTEHSHVRVLRKFLVQMCMCASAFYNKHMKSLFDDSEVDANHWDGWGGAGAVGYPIPL